MITVYHNLDPNLPVRMMDAAFQGQYAPAARDLELAGVVHGTEDLDAAFDRTVHRDGENWTDGPGVVFFGDRRGRRSSREGDVFVDGRGAAFLVLPVGFRPLPGLFLPFLASCPA